MLATVLQWSAVIVAIAAVLGVGANAARFLRRVGHFFDEWFGVEERPGAPKRPGAMERLSGIEGEVTSIKGRVTNLESATAELLPNGGTSLADAVRRIEEKL